MYNAVLEQIHQVIGNLVQTCNITQSFVDEYEPQLGILAESEFSILSTTNRIKGYSPGQFIFGLDLILQIKHTVDWE